MCRAWWPPQKTCYVALLTTFSAFKESLEAHASQAIYLSPPLPPVYTHSQPPFPIHPVSSLEFHFKAASVMMCLLLFSQKLSWCSGLFSRFFLSIFLLKPISTSMNMDLFSICSIFFIYSLGFMKSEAQTWIKVLDSIFISLLQFIHTGAIP